MSENSGQNGGKSRGKLGESRDRGNGKMGKENIKTNGPRKSGKAQGAAGVQYPKGTSDQHGSEAATERPMSHRTHVIVSGSISEVRPTPKASLKRPLVTEGLVHTPQGLSWFKGTNERLRRATGKRL